MVSTLKLHFKPASSGHIHRTNADSNLDHLENLSRQQGCCDAEARRVPLIFLNRLKECIWWKNVSLLFLILRIMNVGFTDKINPSDVGLESIAMVLPGPMGVTEVINGKQHQQVAPPISYLHIYECEAFSMGIFCLPLSAVIPLHNHPGMTVLSKLLYGSMHVKAYDWVDPIQLPSYPRLAKQVANCVMSAPCESSILYPASGGNIHAFTAVTSCAVLDILAPPYSIEDGRHCTYYRDLPYSGDVAGGEDGTELAVLEEYKPPDDFSVRGAPYRGPELVL